MKKKRLRELIPALIEAMEKGETQQQGGQTVININMNINEVKAEAKAENKVEVKPEDVQAIRALIEDLLRLLSNYMPQQNLRVLRRRAAIVERVLSRLEGIN